MHRHNITTRALTVALSAALLVPAAALAVTGLAPIIQAASDGDRDVVAAAHPDDQIPGVALPSTPVVGTLDDTYPAFDFDDVYAIQLEHNEKLVATMTASARTDFDLWLWKPGSTSVNQTNPGSRIAQSSQTRGTSSESFYFPCSQPGTYYVDVFVAPGTTPNKGAYALEWNVETLATPQVSVATNRSTCGYKGSATLSGVVTVADAALPAARVLVQSRPAGSTGGWTSLNYDTKAKPIAPRTMTDGNGRFSLTVSSIKRKTDYRAIVWPSESWGWATSKPTRVSPRASLTRPYAPKTVYKNRSFKVHGYLKPKHRSGSKHVRISAYRRTKGVWRYAKSYNYRSYTKYAATMALPSKGKWKLVATTPEDSGHLSTTSSPTYVTVK